MAFYQNQQQFNIPQNVNSPQNELQQQNQPNYPQLSPLPSQQTNNQQFQQQQNVNLYNENNNQQDGNLNQELQQYNNFQHKFYNFQLHSQQVSPNLENNINMQIGGNFAKRFEQVFKNSLNAQNQDQQELSGGAPFMDQFKKQFAQNLAQNMMNNILQEELQQSKQKILQTNQNQHGDQQSQAEADKSLFQKCCACLTLDFYKPYFNVTTDIVKDRLLYSFNPLNEGFFQLHNEYKPDLQI
ncbi:hypothetical protein PPERSA_09747 [Pseudocohnilembus persalinus]|uniref:Uncharacterized protein n=1 Tax=Pseudocohnilembus persalinus TaxID=266149 RepID=A0A0V0QTT7_PSEPJ|nr:hypothetical protein PPERSA_09747 [Pseudocohnilembus persalinus]|eukprot:KRX05607.1 hypothetical protein PPERSA_09747 [Pseudocohnilembus persalinus]